MRPPQFIRGPEPSRTQAVFLHSRPKRGICAEALIVAAEAWMSLNGLAKRMTAKFLLQTLDLLCFGLRLMAIFCGWRLPIAVAMTD